MDDITGRCTIPEALRNAVNENDLIDLIYKAMLANIEEDKIRRKRETNLFYLETAVYITAVTVALCLIQF